MAIFRLACLGSLPLLVVGCAGLEKPATPTSQPAPIVTAPAPSPKADAPPPQGSSKARRGPLPIRALNVRSDCSFKDETGYNGAMKLRVAAGLVQEFEATVNHPKHGTCRFSLPDFRQTKDMPNVELQGERNRCTVRMWEQGRQVAVAFSSCHKMCTGDVVDYLWPILADSFNGTCG